MAKSDNPARWKAEAKAAWDQVQQRHVGAKSNFLPRVNRIRGNQAAWSAYMLYLLRTNQREEMDRVWSAAPRELKEGNPRIFVTRLMALGEDDDVAIAEQIINEMHQFKVQPNLFHFNALIGCHRKGGRWAEAEAVWQRMLNSGIKPDRVSYRVLMQVYMHDGSPAQLNKIERLHTEMQATPLRFDATDYQALIKRSHACRLSSEARKWSERAKAASVWKNLDETTHNIIASIDEWKELPRGSKGN